MSTLQFWGQKLPWTIKGLGYSFRYSFMVMVIVLVIALGFSSRL